MLSCIIFRKESDSGHLGADFTTFHSENCQVKVRRPKTGPSDRKFGTIIRPKKSQESSLFISGPFGACFLWILAENCKTKFCKKSYIFLYYPILCPSLLSAHAGGMVLFWWDLKAPPAATHCLETLSTGALLQGRSPKGPSSMIWNFFKMSIPYPPHVRIGVRGII